MTPSGRSQVATIDDIDVAGRRVLVRVDLNVPMKSGEIVDDRRIRAALPTITTLRQRGARVVLVTHLGRPEGRDQTFSTEPLARRLGELLGTEVRFADDTSGEVARAAVGALADGDIVMLQNIRFEAGETSNDPALAARLAELADIYINDAFGTAHRAHASTEGIAHVRPAVAGYLMAHELEILGGLFDNPARPVVGILGGSKISTKLGVIGSLQDRVDTLWIGGAMACSFYLALGKTTGNSLVERDQVETAAHLFHDAAGHRATIKLPVDVVVAERAEAGAVTSVVDWTAIPDGAMVVDIGPQTVNQIAASCVTAGTVIWNGPLGIYEIDEFANGTRRVAEAVAGCGASTVIGGGDLAAAVEAAGVADRIGHVSTGGGATLEFLEGKTLPGVAALRTATRA